MTDSIPPRLNVTVNGEAFTPAQPHSTAASLAVGEGICVQGATATDCDISMNSRGDVQLYLQGGNQALAVTLPYASIVPALNTNDSNFAALDQVGRTGMGRATEIDDIRNGGVNGTLIGGVNKTHGDHYANAATELQKTLGEQGVDISTDKARALFSAIGEITADQRRTLARINLSADTELAH